MNTNQFARRIMCFGDSNTYGKIPALTYTTPNQRFASDQRRTCLLQHSLGNEYEIIEEGRGGRTINTPGGSNHDDMTKVGSLFLEGLIESHYPLDLIVVMLGTNDCKVSFGYTAQEIANQMKNTILDRVKKYAIPLMLVSPPPIVSIRIPEFSRLCEEKVKELCTLYESLASDEGIMYLSLHDSLSCGEDGIHLDRQSHVIMAQTLSSKIQNFFA